jgi:hypothetical protein
MPIAKARVQADFQKLAKLLRCGRQRDAPDPVAWIETRNLLPAPLELAARLMQATAFQNVRVQKPVYHMLISWPNEDQPSQEAILRTVDRVLADLGLEEHQAVLLAHNDNPRPHVHVMLNRVHPETLKTWDNKHDWRRIEAILRAVEREEGWRRVPRDRFPRSARS